MVSSLPSHILEKISPLSTPERPVYVVGGAVRDMLLERPVHDLDFAVSGPTRPLAQEAARRLKGAFYVLDEERDTTRVVLNNPGRPRMLLDFATLRGGDLEEDLRARDFTINAMAFDAARPGHLLDPTGGLADLREKRLRACSPTSLSDDPVRVLRLVRQSLAYQLRIDPQTLEQARAAAPRLPRISAERLRDELFRILDGRQVHLAMRLLLRLDALQHVLPELIPLQGAAQSAPHVEDVWEHTLDVAQALEQLFPPLVGDYDAAAVPDLTVGSAVLWLGRYRQQFSEHYARFLVPDRTPRALLFLAALYHDAGKPDTRTVTPDGRTHFLDHPRLSGEMAARRARALALSTAEVERLQTIVVQHMRVHFLAGTLRPDGEDRPSRRAIYRFFRDTGTAGVDICLLSLADTRGTYGVTLPQDAWQAELQACRALLEACWEKNEEIVAPPRLLTGDDLIRLFQIKPGRRLGSLLAAIRESQAAGEVATREEAEDFARRWLARQIVFDTNGEEGEEQHGI